MKRKENWKQSLTEFLAHARRTNFEWGKNDCCMFACDAIQAMTGEDLGSEFRGLYDDEASAMLSLLELGYTGIENLVEKKFLSRDVLEIPVSMAMQGDVVVLESNETPFGATIGICLGAFSIIPGEKELIKFKTRRFKRAWNIR